MFRSRKKSPVSVTVAKAALESIFDECDRYDADETGGRLLGTYRTRKGGVLDIDVSGVIGPGPRARRTATSFFQDGDYQEQIFRAIEERHPDIEHLGNWHTHHVNGYPTLSGGDITTYRNIVNHEKHNTDFFYALLIVRRNSGKSPRYEVRHYVLRRDDESVYEIPSTHVRVVDAPLCSTDVHTDTTASTYSPETPTHSSANPERTKDKEFFSEFYPDIGAFFSERMGMPYWKGPLTLIDGSRVDVVAAEYAGDGTPYYSIATSGASSDCAEVAGSYKGRTFTSARCAIVQLERALNNVLYSGRK